MLTDCVSPVTLQEMMVSVPTLTSLLMTSIAENKRLALIKTCQGIIESKKQQLQFTKTHSND
jgi:hypothetical protein